MSRFIKLTLAGERGRTLYVNTAQIMAIREAVILDEVLPDGTKRYKPATCVSLPDRENDLMVNETVNHIIMAHEGTP